MISIRRIGIFIGLKVVEIVAAMVCAVLLLALIIFLIMHPILFVVAAATIVTGGILFTCQDEIRDWFRSNWRKAGELDRRWRKK